MVLDHVPSKQVAFEKVQRKLELWYCFAKDCTLILNKDYHDAILTPSELLCAHTKFTVLQRWYQIHGKEEIF